jgi:hypothetical protein
LFITSSTQIINHLFGGLLCSQYTFLSAGVRIWHHLSKVLKKAFLLQWHNARRISSRSNIYDHHHVKIFAKANKPGWAAIIPIYNMIVLLEVVGRPFWWILLKLIPCVNIVIGSYSLLLTWQNLLVRMLHSVSAFFF